MSESSHNDIIESTPFNQPPSWAREAIWYQIFVERFRNGNPANNPTRETCYNALIDPIPEDWQLTPWGYNWYRQEDWAKKTGLDFYRTVQMRRYGGDLDGVIEKIPYLVELGITAVYFNPLNDAPSLHKYDARHYHHIDITFGDDPEGDLRLMSQEKHDDPTTWKWTSADRKFLELVRKLHDHHIRVILDYSWNHTGTNFWAFKDLLDNTDASPYKDWYFADIKIDPVTQQKVVEYQGWMGITSLPELRKVNVQNRMPGFGYEGNLYDPVKWHIFHVTRRWMDPYGNGNFTSGIDGMRLDVAEHIPLGFWRDFRRYVRSVNPDFYLVGECWWEVWPDKLMDPLPWVNGDIFDAVMHYQWFKVARAYFAEPSDKISLSTFKDMLGKLFLKYPPSTQQAMMNLASSHDSPRLLSTFFNHNKYKFHCKPQEDKEYRTDMPGEFTFQRVKLFLLHQFTFVGAPHIWNGDEMGMLGADDPDNRKPLTWPDIAFDPETQSSFSSYKYSYTPAFDTEMFEYYKSLIQLRKSDLAFIYGDFGMIDVSVNNTILAYTRSYGQTRYWIIINNHTEYNEAYLPFEPIEIIFSYNLHGVHLDKVLLMPPFSGIVIKQQ
jgi:cyclomaltodextrinase